MKRNLPEKPPSTTSVGQGVAQQVRDFILGLVIGTLLGLIQCKEACFLSLMRDVHEPYQCRLFLVKDCIHIYPLSSLCFLML